MPANLSRKLKSALLLALGCAAVFTAALAGASSLKSWLRDREAGREAGGFDYGPLVSEENRWAGPKVGERIDLSALKDADGRALSSAAGGGPLMALVLDPHCGACEVAADQIREVREAARRDGVPYYIVSFTASEYAPAFFEYADSLGLDAAAYVWPSAGQPPPEALSSLVVPSHLLLDSGGVVLKKWPGTDQRGKVRMRMANQTSRDLHEIVLEKFSPRAR